MRHHTAGTKVPGGFYFNRASWELVTVPGKDGELKGEAAGRYVRVPTLLLLAGAPLFSGAYVLFLPFIGFALFFREVARKAKVTRVRTAIPAHATAGKRTA